MQGGAVLSEIRADPGPTDSIFDVLAALAHAFSRGPRVALLGFAGGGLVAPLRAMGSELAIDAVDLDLQGARIFEELSTDWKGDVRVAQDDAVDWLARRRRAYDVIVEDLSELGIEGETKPLVSVTALPEAIAERLRPAGIVIINLLPVPGVSWRSLQRQVLAPWQRAVIVEPAEFENRILLTGPRVPATREVSAGTLAALRGIGSAMAREVRFRGFAP